MSSSESSRGIPSYALPFYEAIFDEQSAKWRRLSPAKQREQSVEALALRHLAGYQDLVREQLKTIPLTDQDQIPAIAKRLQAATSFVSLEASGLPTGCKEAFERLTELERDADQYVPRGQVNAFRQFVEGEIAQYGKELLDPALGSKLLKESSGVVSRRQTIAEQSPEDLKGQREELERHREAQRKVPQTLGLTQEQFDAGLAAELGGAAQLAAAQRRAAEQRSSHPGDVRLALHRLGFRGEDLRRRMARFPLDGLQVRDVQLLGMGLYPLDRYWLLAEAGFTPLAIRAQAPYGIEEVPINRLFDVAETAVARGHNAPDIDYSDWLLTSVLAAQENGIGIPGLPDSLADLTDQLRNELRVVARARVDEQLQRIEAEGMLQQRLHHEPQNPVARFRHDMAARIRQHPTEWLAPRDVRSLFFARSGDALLRKYESLLDMGSTLAELRVLRPRRYRGAGAEVLLGAVEVSQARGYGPSMIDESDFVLNEARHLFPHPDSLAQIGRDERLRTALAMLVREDVEVELQRLEDEAMRRRPRDQNKPRILRAILAEYPPIEGMCLADVDDLNEMSIQKAANLLARYDSLQRDGYTLGGLRESYPSGAWGRIEMNDLGVMQFPGMPTMNELVVVGEAARDRKVPPSQVGISVWMSVWNKLRPTTTYRFMDLGYAAPPSPATNHMSASSVDRTGFLQWLRNLLRLGER